MAMLSHYTNKIMGDRWVRVEGREESVKVLSFFFGGGGGGLAR